MMGPILKRVRWVNSSLDDLRAFPPDARQRAGRELQRVQRGQLPTDWKPMQGVGTGACEIRIKTQVQHRVIYVARFQEAIYVLHAFEKKSQKTAKGDVEIARKRYAAIVRARQE